MAESYSVKAILSAQDRGFTSTLKSALGATESLASKIKSGFAFGVLTGVGQKAFSMITSGVSDLVGEIDASNAAWKTFDGNMRIIGKDDKEITRVKKELQKFAQETVYSSSDMASTYAQLAAVGVDSADQLVKGFGGLAAAAENPQQAMKTLSQQATQMAGKPKVAWQDFKLMMEQTPAGIAAVSKEMGMTTSELVANVQDGKIKTSEFFKAVEKVGTSKGFSKLATEYKTVGQAMDGLQETVGNKLTPAFDVLSQRGISAVTSLADKFDEIDGEKLATKVTKGFEKIDQYWGTLKSSFSGVGTEVKEAFDAVKEACSGLTDTLGDVTSVESFGDAMSKLAGWIKTAANFIEDHADTIGKALPWVLKLGAAWKGFGIVKKYVPGVGLLTGALKSLAGNAVSGLASKLFKTSEGMEAAGKSSGNSSKKMIASAKAFMMVGAGVLMVAAGFALLAYSAIQLSSAGGLAIGVMVGMVAAVAALGAGMMFMLNSIKPGPAKLKAISLAFIAVGAAVLMVSAGFALMAYSAIQLSYAGAPAIAIMAGMVVTMALLAVGASLLGKALTAGAVGFIAFGAAIALVGAGALLAAVGVTLLANSLPLIIAYGAQGAAALVTLSGGMVVFAGGAAVAGAACLVLGAGLAVAAIGVAALGVAVLALAAGMAVVSVSLSVTGAALPLVASGAALTTSAFVMLLGASTGLSGVLVLLSGSMLTLSAGAAVACAGVVAFGAAMLVTAAGTVTMAVAIKSVNSSMKSIASNAKSAEKSLKSMQKSVSLVQSGLDSLGGKAKSAMNSLTNALDNTANKANSAGQKTGNGFNTGMQSGLKSAQASARTAGNQIVTVLNKTSSSVQKAGQNLGKGFANGEKAGLRSAVTAASSAVSQVNAKLRSGHSAAYSAGSYIGKGFANGMRSQLSSIKSAAAQMAAAADKAVKAKAKIHSPSKVAEDNGGYYGQGWINGILSRVKASWAAAEKLVTFPQLSIPALSGAYGGELSSDYNYYHSAEFTINVPLDVDGKEFARATAKYNQAELDKQSQRNSRKHGKA